MITGREIKHHNKNFQGSLDFFQQENALLKYRLSEIVDDSEERGFLQLAEYFQNELLLNDERLSQLAKRLHLLSDQISTYGKNKNISENFAAIQDKFRTDLLEFETRFLSLSEDFNQKLLQTR